MKPIVSVIIPVYNVEQFLPRCVKSVLHQTLKELEIILIDDGSPDNSAAICDRYAQQDNRVVVIHKKNGGLASARNAGIRVARGEYIFFLDSDDWLEPDGMEHLVQLAEQYAVDFVRYRAIRTGWPGLPENAPCMLESVREIPGGMYNAERIRVSIYPRLLATPELTLGPVVGAWGALYRLSFLNKHNLLFYENIQFSEDVLFSANVICHSRNFYYDDVPGVYHYFYNQSSISKSFRAGRWTSCKRLIEQAEKDFNHNGQYDFKRQLNYLTWFCIMLALGERKRIGDRKKRQAYCKEILKDTVVRNCPLKLSWFRVSWKQKVLMLIIKMGLWRIISEV